jgi:hypothetical protein
MFDPDNVLDLQRGAQAKPPDRLTQSDSTQRVQPVAEFWRTGL